MSSSFTSPSHPLPAKLTSPASSCLLLRASVPTLLMVDGSRLFCSLKQALGIHHGPECFTLPGAEDSLPIQTGHSKALTLLGLQLFPGELGKSHNVGEERQGRFPQAHTWRALSSSPWEAWKFGSEAEFSWQGSTIVEANNSSLGESSKSSPLPEMNGNIRDSQKLCIVVWRK